MAIMPQQPLFSWEQADVVSDLHRLEMVVGVLPDEPLMLALEAERKGRRDDYPVRPLWNALLACIVFGHGSIESLRRELLRNGELRQICGFNPGLGAAAVPPKWVFTRFLKKLYRHRDLVDGMFHGLVERLKGLLPDYGVHLAIDSKAIGSHSTGRKGEEDGAPSDPNADWGAKTYKGVHKDGTAWEKTTRWFGYKLHLIVDAVHELPVAWDMTKASVHDNTMVKPLVEQMEKHHGDLVKKAETLAGDRAYDAKETNAYLHDEKKIFPVIDNRMMWKDEPGRPRPLDGDRVDTMFYRETGEVVCRCLNGPVEKDNYAAMAFCGYEKDRESLKYRCPASAYGMTCTQQDICNGGTQSEWGRIVRVSLEKDRRIFIPVPRSSNKFKRLYKRRTSIERVNGRLDNSFGFEKHFIRGMNRMRLRMGMALLVMLAMAVGCVEAGKPENMRSLVWARAA
jgi:hypothetical protein